MTILFAASAWQCLAESMGERVVIFYICFIHPIFCFLFLVTFGDEVTKIQKYYVIFVYILQGKMSRKENHATKVTKIPKTKRPKYGMNETIVHKLCNTNMRMASPRQHQSDQINCHVIWQAVFYPLFILSARENSSLKKNDF